MSDFVKNTSHLFLVNNRITRTSVLYSSTKLQLEQETLSETMQEVIPKEPWLSMEKDHLLPTGNLSKAKPKIVSSALPPGTYYPVENGLYRSHNGSKRRIKYRAVSKKGDFNVEKTRYRRRPCSFVSDLFTKLVEARWRWTLSFVFLITVAVLIFFAFVWWIIVYAHGDLRPENMPPLQENNSWVPCITNIYSFTSCFLFSVEIQTTIGYGSRHINENCPQTIIVMILQDLAGVIIPSFMVGIVFAKLSRPKHRSNTLIFSKNAIISQRDRRLCLIFRVGDLRKSRIVDAKVSAYLIRSRNTVEGELLEHDQAELKVQVDGCEGDPLFIWPIAVVHVIDSESPFYMLSAADLLQSKIEVVSLLEGVIESTGQEVQARSSYIASEILWGHRFVSMVSYKTDRQGYEVDYSKFDKIVKVYTPLCSGWELKALIGDG